MEALLAILWFVGIVIAVMMVYEFVGAEKMVRMFPEGRRWWLFPAQMASIAFLASLAINHPFK